MTKETHFNATQLLRELHPNTKLKVAMFLDNENIKCKITIPTIVTRGRYGKTLIQNELKHLFTAWVELQK